MAQTSKPNAADEGCAEASQVLAQYLELFTYDCNQFKFYLNANSVVDWFGRSVRGPAKIHDYLSKEVGSQYEHNEFKLAESCGPIEYKPTHMKTKIASTVEVDNIHPRNRVSGLTTLKTYADSDLEDDGDNMEMMPLTAADANKTPEKQKLNNTVIEELTPPTSTIKFGDGGEEEISATESEDDNEHEMMSTKAKRLKRTRPTPFSYLRRLPTGRKLIKSESDDDDSSSSNTSSDSDFLQKNVQKLDYTPLRYLEARGVLRRRELPKSTVTSTSPQGGDGSWEREIRIRISYRTRVHDQRLEFALVIYEHLSTIKTPRRRNLIAEFCHTDTAADGVVDDPLAAGEVERVGGEEEEEEKELPALVINEEEQTVATVASPNTDEIAAALETAAFTIVPLRTPTKMLQTPPATPKRRQRLPASASHSMSSSGLKRSSVSPSTSTTTLSTPKRSAARSLRL